MVCHCLGLRLTHFELRLDKNKNRCLASTVLSASLLARVALEVNVGRHPEAGHCRKAEVLGPGCSNGAGGGGAPGRV